MLDATTIRDVYVVFRFVVFCSADNIFFDDLCVTANHWFAWTPRTNVPATLNKMLSEMADFASSEATWRTGQTVCVVFDSDLFNSLYMKTSRHPQNRKCITIISERELTFIRYMLSPVRPSVCLSVVWLSITFVHPTQPIEFFSEIFLRHLVPWPSVDIHGKFYGDRPRGTLYCEFKRKRGSQI